MIQYNRYVCVCMYACMEIINKHLIVTYFSLNNKT